MRFSKYILFVFSSLWVLGISAANSDNLVDSLYKNLSPEERLNQLIWVNGDTQDDLSYDIYNYGGVYFGKPLEIEPLFDGMAVAVKLDERINPIPSTIQNLPDLQTLASISKSEILSTYFYFLKSTSKAHGIDYLVLPNSSSKAEGLLLEKMVAFDPVFFKNAQSISYEQTKKKKQITHILKTNDYWVLETKNLDRVSRNLSKVAKRIDENVLETKIKHALYSYTTSHRDHERRPLPNKLAVAISKASVIPIQKRSGILPVTADTISLITDHPYGPLANMLRKYAYVQTSYEDISASDYIVLIDDQSFVPEQLLDTSKTIIFMGDIEFADHYLEEMDAALVYTHYNQIFDYVLPQQIFGTSAATGVFPIDHPRFSGFSNTRIRGMDILGYAPPEMTGIDLMTHKKIEDVITEAISSGSTPGCQLAVALEGAIILDESYGHLTYDSLLPVDRKTLYDLASVTKVSATLLAVMKLYEDGKLDLDKTLGDYLPQYANTNKRDLTIRSILAHNAGLKSYVPFWKRALDQERLETFYYDSEEDQKNDKRSYGMRPDPVLVDSLKNWILQSPLINKNEEPFYHYSDIGFMILHQVVEEVTGMPMENFLHDEFYGRMKLDRLTFNPMDNGFDLFEIAPTEYDYYFRDELVWGQVHDRNAAVFGGVAGHAGLFSNAHNLLIILQTMLQSGRYAEHQYLSQETIDYFNHRYFPENRRGLGWDKKGDRQQITSDLSSDISFGHTGFTGTMVWVDPAYNLIFVFLSNRIHPNANNYQLIQRNIRTRIQDVVYEAILTKWMN